MRFNTQPPEGGWERERVQQQSWYRFNTQPPEGGWDKAIRETLGAQAFQHTAARRRLVIMMFSQ
ncbi:hypothetical protein NEIMUCOT_04698 [Neisseria mucosa ATCC 25996]|uniref:Uncharacterized protein n=1 Tax=Neisseria mucosa (strain ATCC 25996 / DSM 4631 / NCTC 10774 / M26) TaxID=546266 RepID=D2ZVQ5_NEIM2|nr:hypothetical protein NEIMUCOT_04698 [Neisseria mucosa ATCC 25996]SUA36995.1 Uncharacterised protein [Neisseria mucosa]